MTLAQVPPIGPQDLHLAAHLFQPVRLTIAREYRGLTRAQLASKVNRTPSAIGQFEGGRTKPDAQTVGSLSLALQVPLSFFVRTQTVPSLSTDSCNFRSLRSATQRDRRRLLAAGSLLCDIVAVIEEHVEFPAEAVPRSLGDGADQADAESVEVQADSVRSAWGLGLGPLPNIVDLLERHGIIVIRVPDECTEVDAFSAWSGGRPLIFLVSDEEDANRSSRLRFDAAHELGHLVLHSEAVPADRRLEAQANRFGAAFLMPAASFRMECPRRLDWGHLFELKRRWGTSVAAIVRRAFDLGCFSEASYRRACVELNKAGFRHREPDEPPLEEPRLLKQAISLATEVRSLAALAERLGMSPSDLAVLTGL